MHNLLDEIFLNKFKQASEIQHIRKDDEEEQKELDLKKQYDLFRREAKELDQYLERLNEDPKREIDVIREVLNTLQEKKDEMNKRFNRISIIGSQVIEEMIREFKKWNEGLQQGGERAREEKKIEKIKREEHKLKLYLISVLQSTR